MKTKISLLFASALACLPAFAESNYNQISFSTEVRQTVTNDEIRIRLSKTTQATTPKAVATVLTTAINEAVARAKKYPDVKLNTGHQHTYPRYNNDKIVGHTGYASVELVSRNLTQASELMAELQNTLTVDSIDFGVSDAKERESKHAMMTQAINKFQTEAVTISRAFGANDYKIVNVKLGSSHHEYVASPAPMMMRASKASDSVPTQDFEAGESTLTYTASGTIELVK